MISGAVDRDGGLCDPDNLCNNARYLIGSMNPPLPPLQQVDTFQSERLTGYPSGGERGLG